MIIDRLAENARCGRYYRTWTNEHYTLSKRLKLMIIEKVWLSSFMTSEEAFIFEKSNWLHTGTEDMVFFLNWTEDMVEDAYTKCYIFTNLHREVALEKQMLMYLLTVRAKETSCWDINTLSMLASNHELVALFVQLARS